MKKLLLFILSLAMLIIFVPFTVSLFWSKNQDKTPKSMVNVYIVNENKTKSFDLEEYLFGVLSGEMPAAFPEEALKAQAVAARTYALNKMNNNDSKHPSADLCTDSTHCKAWLSDKEIKEKFGEEWFSLYKKKIEDAIDETKGEIMVFENEPILAVFHSTNGGRTENSKDVWGGDLPYLQSVESRGDSSSPKFTSTVTVSLDEFKKKTGSAEISDITRSEGGSVKNITIGKKNFKGTEIRSLFSLNSSNFDIEINEDKVVFSVLGYGHGIGMSQYGAKGFAEEGYSYKEILQNYYKGVSFKNIGDK